MEKTFDMSVNLNLLDEKGVYEAFHVDGNEAEALTDSYFELYRLLGYAQAVQALPRRQDTINDNELDQNSTLDYMYQIFSAYQAGCDDLSQWQGSAPESSTNNTNDITEQDRKIIEDAGFEWVEPITVKNSSITGVIRNVSGNVLSGSIQFNLYDESGYQLGEAYDTIADIADGESWRFKAAIIDVDNEVRSYKLISLSMMQF